MRFLGSLLATVALLVIGLGAQQGSGTDGRQEKKTKGVKAETLCGTMQSVDNHRIKVRTSGNITTAVQLDSQTQITIDGKKGALTDLKAGQTVVCTFVRREGVSAALTIAATSPKR